MENEKEKDDPAKSRAMQKMRTRILRTGSKSTFETYSLRLGRFLKWAELSPDEFVAAVESGEVYPPEILNDFFDGISDAPKSLKTYAAAVKKLLKTNLSRSSKRGIDWDDLALPKMRTVETDKAPTREVIKRTLAESRGARDRVFPLIALASGMRIGSIAQLTVGEVDLEKFPDVAVIRVKPDIAKGEVGYVTFLTKEAKTALTEYLDQRRRGGEDIGDGSPVVATPAGGFYSDPGTLSERWSRMLDRAGLGEKGRRNRVYHFHTLRKFFRTALERAGVSKSFRERLLGHSGEYLDASYFDPAFEELLVNYRTATAELTIYAPEVNGKVAMEAALASMQATARLYGIDPMKIRIAKEYVAPIDEIKLLQEAIEGAQSEAPRIRLLRGRTIEPQQLVIEQDNLQAHINDGWRFVSALNNGSSRVIVER